MFDYPVIEQKIAVSFRSSPSKSLPDDGSWPGYQVCEKLMRVGNPKSMAAGDPVTLPQFQPFLSPFESHLLFGKSSLP